MRLSDEVREHYRRLGRIGGKARAKALSPRRRKAIASMGGKTARDLRRLRVEYRRKILENGA